MSVWAVAATNCLVSVRLALVVLEYVGSEAPYTRRGGREPRTASMSVEDRQQAVTALVLMVHEWWSGDRGRSGGAVRGSDQSGGAAAGDQR